MISFEFCIIILELVISKRLFRLSRYLYSGPSRERLISISWLLLVAFFMSLLTVSLIFYPYSYVYDTVSSLVLRFLIVVFNVIGLSMLVVHPADFTWKVVLGSAFNRFLVISVLSLDCFLFLTMINNLM